LGISAFAPWESPFCHRHFPKLFNFSENDINAVPVSTRKGEPMATLNPEKIKFRAPSDAWMSAPDPLPAGDRLAELTEVDTESDTPTHFNGSKYTNEFVGRSKVMRGVLKQIEIVAPTNASVLITGETGTGKELVARAIHGLSRRRNQTLAKINCAAIPSGLLESELFGHEKGSFTGAIARRTGRFEIADKGSLFLDEIGDFPPDLQPKLLRVLQEKEFERVGSNRSQAVDVRLVAATSRDLPQMVADKEFRSDLFYRLNVFPIRLPPLRERSSDIPLLVEHFVGHFCQQLQKEVKVIPLEVMAALKSYQWPGNIRELQNFIERSVILSSGDTLNAPMEELERPFPIRPASGMGFTSRAITLQDNEREHIIRALTQTRWLVGGPNGAAMLLGINRTTLLSRMQKLGISRRPKLAD
jgi:formate hydrogenlyase transcriptional activator